MRPGQQFRSWSLLEMIAAYKAEAELRGGRALLAVEMRAAAKDERMPSTRTIYEHFPSLAQYAIASGYEPYRKRPPAQRTVCKSGRHELTPDSVDVYQPTGKTYVHRRCAECRREWNRNAEERARRAVGVQPKTASIVAPVVRRERKKALPKKLTRILNTRVMPDQAAIERRKRELEAHWGEALQRRTG